MTMMPNQSPEFRDDADIRMRTVVAVSFFVHLLLLSVLGGTDGMSEDDKKKSYISVELIRKSAGFNQSSGPSRSNPAKRTEAKPQRIEKEEAMQETSMSLTPVIAPAEQPVAAETSVVQAGPAAAPASGGDADYQMVHRTSRPPVFRTQVNPVYPASERNAGKESRVVAEVYINRNGGVDEVKLIKSGGAAFDEAVIRALKASSFEPGYMDGRQVAVRMQIPYAFRLR